MQGSVFNNGIVYPIGEGGQDFQWTYSDVSTFLLSKRELPGLTPVINSGESVLEVHRVIAVELHIIRKHGDFDILENVREVVNEKKKENWACTATLKDARSDG